MPQQAKTLLLTRGERKVRVSERELLDVLLDGLSFPWTERSPKARLLVDPESLETTIRSRLAAATHQLFTGKVRAVAATRTAPRPRNGRERRRHQATGTGSHRIADARLRPRAAWMERETLLSPDGRSPLAQRFLALVAEHSREPYSVTQAIRALGIGRSTFERTCADSFHRSPGLLINLGRIASVASDLRETRHTLKVIAAHHGFPTASIMSRMFARFVGVSPGAYRAHRAQRTDGNRSNNEEN